MTADFADQDGRVERHISTTTKPKFILSFLIHFQQILSTVGVWECSELHEPAGGEGAREIFPLQ